MSSQIFEFKEFAIKQDQCAMKVGTDAVLLGAWVNCKCATSILDIGTGTGVIALMLAQKSSANIDAIEIDEASHIQANKNCLASKWKERIKIHHTSLQIFAGSVNVKYDLIVSNPPYFIDSSKATGSERTKARHTDMLPYDQLINSAAKLLSEKGALCVILPLKESELFRELAEAKNLHLSKLTRVKTTSDKQEKRLLMQFEKKPKSFFENVIIIEKDERHSYTDDYKELTKDYYLAF